MRSNKLVQWFSGGVFILLCIVNTTCTGKEVGQKSDAEELFFSGIQDESKAWIKMVNCTTKGWLSCSTLGNSCTWYRNAVQTADGETKGACLLDCSDLSKEICEKNTFNHCFSNNGNCARNREKIHPILGVSSVKTQGTQGASKASKAYKDIIEKCGMHCNYYYECVEVSQKCGLKCQMIGDQNLCDTTDHCWWEEGEQESEDLCTELEEDKPF
ncbi:MAG: hypothetical protein AAF471_06270 [Myxococcota bacterium]